MSLVSGRMLSSRTSFLGSSCIRSGEEANKINQQLDKELAERARLDLYLRIPGFKFSDVRNHCLLRIKEMRGYTDFSKFYESDRFSKDLPTSSEIVMSVFVNFVLESHPGLKVIDDYRDIMEAYTPRRTGTSL
jgi:hypothetical protein